MVICGLSVCAQERSNIRIKKVVVNTDSIVLDTLSIVPNTFKILEVENNLSKPEYKVDYANGLFIVESAISFDTIRVQYRVFNFRFNEEYYNKDERIVQTGQATENPFLYKPSPKSEDIFSTQGLSKSGGISRGLNFGNNQDLSVNSNLNLQLSGKLTEEINILASITDDNIPIQPDGNTQQLQDFDQVFIQLYNRNTKLTAGDFQLRSTDSYFLKYFKRARGANLQLTIPQKNKSDQLKMEFSGAVSKGKFARNIIQGIEGVQGPYKLRGADNESFIILLAGTERVFVDGRQLKRGENYDYIVNYNSAEIVFTPNELITKDRRIIVEFQYSEKNYARSLFQYKGDFQSNKWKVNLNLFAEQDSKNQPLQQTLNSDDRALLMDVGDNLFSAVQAGVDSTGFSTESVLYAVTDSLGYDSIYVFSTDPQNAVYQLSFSDLGEGNGNYILSDFAANGRTYQWVAPDTISGIIVPNGRFEPVILLVTPKKRQMINSAISYQISKTSSLVTNLAVSNNDVNTFSGIGSSDDIGTAFSIGYTNDRSPLMSDSAGWLLTTGINLEYLDRNFKDIQRFRPVEFERNWNISGVDLSDEQLSLEAALGLTSKDKGTIRYSLNYFDSGEIIQGIRNRIQTNISTNGWTVKIDGSLLDSKGINNTTFLRHKAKIEKRMKNLTLGFEDDQEDNRRFINQNKDTLLTSTYSWFDWRFYISNSDTSNAKFKIFYAQRDESRIKNNALNNAASAEEFGGEYQVRLSKSQALRAVLKNRELKIVDSELISETPESTLLGQIDYNARLAKGGININTFYQVSSGLEPRRAFVYLEVPAGQGTYVWNDYNEDGIKDLNEFEIAQFAYEANYIRAFTPTDEYEKTFSNQLTQTLLLKPSTFVEKETGFWKFIKQLSSQTTFRIDQKSNDDNRGDAYNPFKNNIEDSTLLTFNSLIRNTFSFNRAHPIWGIDLIWNDSENKQLLANGFDSRANQFWQGKLRWNFTEGWAFNLESTFGERRSISDFLTNRNFKYEYLSAKPAISFQPNNKWRLTGNLEIEEKNNEAEFGGEKAEILDAGTELRYSWPGKGSFQFNLNYTNILYNGTENSSLGFEMLEGLKDGDNFTWSILLQRNLSDNLQLNLTYNGRKANSNSSIHNGGIQLRAFF